MEVLMSHVAEKMESEFVEKEVLFQKIGSQWYVFSFDGDQLHFCALPSHLNPKSSKVEIYEQIAQSIEAETAA